MSADALKFAMQNSHFISIYSVFVFLTFTQNFESGTHSGKLSINIYLVSTIGSFDSLIVSYLKILQSFILSISIQKVITILFKFYRRQIANALMFHKTT